MSTAPTIAEQERLRREQERQERERLINGSQQLGSPSSSTMNRHSTQPSEAESVEVLQQGEAQKRPLGKRIVRWLKYGPID